MIKSVDTDRLCHLLPEADLIHLPSVFPSIDLRWPEIFE
jgi:hypothetical protein